MNKRQAKKKFKKEYGCTPDEMARQLETFFSDDNMKKIAESVSKAMDQAAIAVNKMMEDVAKFLQSDELKKIAQAVSELAKEKEEEEARAAAEGVIYSEDMIKKIIEHQVLGDKMNGKNSD